MRIVPLGALLLVLTACASGVANPSAPLSTATIELVSIAPAAGSTIDERTVLAAEIHYAIDHFRSGTDYYIAPLFAENDGPGKTFNEFDHFDEGTHVTAPFGTATVRYGIARELRSDKLARPVQVFFFLMERTGAHTTRVIGSAGPVTYPAAP
jgi:hypothetical protein